jgi:hypothetical protein
MQERERLSSCIVLVRQFQKDFSKINVVGCAG